MRKIIAVFVSLILLTGCSGVPAYQVNERAYVQIFGVSKTGDNFSVYIQLIADGETDVISGVGRTVNDAIADAELSEGKKLFLGHMKLFILGDGLRDISKELEVFLSGDICPACPVAYAENPGEIAALGKDEDGYTADELLKVITVYAEQGKSIITPLTAVAVGTAEGYTAAPVPIISAAGGKLEVGGVTFAAKDGIVGFLAQEDVFGLHCLLGKPQKGGKVTVVSQFDEGNLTAATDILGAKIKKTVTVKNGAAELDIKITLKTDVTENPFGIPDEKIEEATRRYVSNAVSRAFTAAVWDSGKDTVGVAKLLRKTDNAAYEAFIENPAAGIEEVTLRVTVG
ncbi:MAG: hypothetical protein LBL87_05200 [Ruminococcus sp.]|jgi:hypothetical protein|nr:hypothetical protein [Ruminococcus sp.]